MRSRVVAQNGHEDDVEDPTSSGATTKSPRTTTLPNLPVKDKVGTNIKVGAVFCVGIIFGIVVYRSISTERIHHVQKTMVSSYRAHDKARQESVKRYREAYKEALLSEKYDQPYGSSETDVYGLPLKNSWFTHLHIEKTAGSTLAKDISRRYYGICGNKAVSCLETKEDYAGGDWIKVRASQWNSVNDESKSIWTFENMHKRGFHNCALLSEEIPWLQWQKFVLNSKFHENMTKVALLPCREPVSHFLSECNMHNKNVTKYFENGDTCGEVLNRMGYPQKFPGGFQLRFEMNMSNPMASGWDKIVLFKYNRFESVFDLLDKHLPVRKFPLESDKSMKTNAVRKPGNEYLNKCSKADLASELKKRWSYYEFCERMEAGEDIRVLDVLKDGRVMF